MDYTLGKTLFDFMRAAALERNVHMDEWETLPPEAKAVWDDAAAAYGNWVRS